MNKPVLYIGGAVSVYLGYLLMNGKSVKDVFNPDNTFNDISTDYVELYNRFFRDFELITVQNNLSIPISFCLSVLKSESGNNFKKKENKDIVGDILLKYKAYGFMQVRFPALIDVNNKYGVNYSESDLLSERINLTVGAMYLNLCYNKAISENPKNLIALTFRKYNGGVNLKENSIRAIIYGTSTYNHYLRFDSLTEGF